MQQLHMMKCYICYMLYLVTKIKAIKYSFRDTFFWATLYVLDDIQGDPK